MKKRFVLLSLVPFLVGCAPQELKPGMIRMYTNPIVQTARDPEVDYSKYKNFTTYPISDILQDVRVESIVEKQLLFIIRNHLESLCYNHVDTIEQSDFYVGVVFSNEYKSQYIPPSTVTVPWYVPGETQTTHMNLYGSTGYHWGTATTQTPGYYIPMTYTRPGQYIGSYYPFIQVILLDKVSKKPIWQASGIIATPESDIRLSGQVLIANLFFGKTETNFPICSMWNEIGKTIDVNDGTFGVGYRITTLNGNNFYPVVFGIVHESPAYQQRLKIYDVITHINGESTLNWPRLKVRQAFDKKQADSLRITVNRRNKVLEFSLLAVDEAIAQTEWCKLKAPNEKGQVITRAINEVQAIIGEDKMKDFLALIP